MRINPIIPVWAMAIILVLMLVCFRKGWLNFIRQLVVVALIFVINLRIQYSTGDIQKMTKNVNVLFVVDNTLSMVAEDFDGNGRRIDGAVKDCEYIMEQFAGAKFSVIVFENEARRLVPFTYDENTVRQGLISLGGNASKYMQGTTINLALPEMKKALDNDDDAVTFVFFISDGELTKNAKLESFAEVSEFIDDGLVLGYGTDKGGKMKVYAYSGADEKEYYEYYDDSYNFTTAISKIDEENLKTIADDLDIDYVHVTKNGMLNDKISNMLEKVEDEEYSEKDTSDIGYKDTYFYFAMALIAFLVFDLIYYRRKLR